MRKQISYRPFCGEEFPRQSSSPDARSAAGYRCEGCDEVLELNVNRFPLA